MEGKEMGLERLNIWQKSMALAVTICREILPLFPAEEKWTLSNQLRRSIQSVPANIAEGHGRFHYQDAVRFCYMARGSLQEAYTQLLLAHQLGYINEKHLEPLSNEIHELEKMINGYIQYLKTSKHGDLGQTHQVREENPPYRLMLDYEV